MWRSNCEENWKRYAKKHDIDIIAIDKVIDQDFLPERSLAWQKCLILEHPEVLEYDQVAWVDSDIVMNPDAPNIFDGIPVEKIGGVQGFKQLYHSGEDAFGSEILNYIKTPYKNEREWYKLNKLTPEYTDVLQTGVVIMSPKYHRELLKGVFYSNEDSVTGDYEMPILSHRVIEGDLIHWIDERFNLLWTGLMCHKYPQCLPTVDGFFIRQYKKYIRGHYMLPAKKVYMESLKEGFKNSFFLHFAGNSYFLDAVDFNTILD